MRIPVLLAQNLKWYYGMYYHIVTQINSVTSCTLSDKKNMERGTPFSKLPPVVRG
jgi:hypothetical protein